MSTKTSTTLTAKPTLGSGPWRTRALLIASFAGVGLLGVAIGRRSSPLPAGAGSAGDAAAPAVSSGDRGRSPASSAAALSTPEPLKVDLTEIPSYQAGVPMRPMDRDIFDKLQTLRLERTQMPDVFPDRPYRVTFVGSLVERNIGLVVVDLDRDGKLDERWELKRGEVIRTVQKDPAAHGQPVKYTVIHGRWQPH